MSAPPKVVHELVSELDYPMFIVTVAASGELAGCLVGFTTQCSIDPPRFLVCLSVKNRTYRVAKRADALVVHLLPQGADELAEPSVRRPVTKPTSSSAAVGGLDRGACRCSRNAATGSPAACSTRWTRATMPLSCSSRSRPPASPARARSPFTARGGWIRARGLIGLASDTRVSGQQPDRRSSHGQHGARHHDSGRTVHRRK